MKAKTKFMKMYYKLPEKARKELVFDAYGSNPMTLNIICLEIRHDTKMGLAALKHLGYEDDK